MTGRELRQRRESNNIKQYELGAEMGVASTRISQIEALAQVTTVTQERYLAALGRCLVAKTPQTAQEVA
jgi:transcriptional regulator with XRE-family HTH domain